MMRLPPQVSIFHMALLKRAWGLPEYDSSDTNREISREISADETD